LPATKRESEREEEKVVITPPPPLYSAVHTKGVQYVVPLPHCALCKPVPLSSAVR